MNREDLIDQARTLAAERVTDAMDKDEKMDVLEMAMMELLDVQIMKPPLGRVGTMASGGPGPASGRWLMHEDPRLPDMPETPTLMDFFRLRIMLDGRGANHLLQSAKLAADNGVPEKIVLACLLHDISAVGFIRTDHGHWAVQLVAPYVDEEVAWAIRHHQSLRFLPSEAHGYAYPKLYTMAYGEDYTPPAYIRREWDMCRNHKWYESAMQIVLNDLYAFDPDVVVELESFEDIIGRHFKQPDAGLGFDESPVAHMWRTMIWPNNFL